MGSSDPGFRSVPAAELIRRLGSTPDGLSVDEARQRLARYGANLLRPAKKTDAIMLLASPFTSPIILILLFATGMSFVLHDPADALIIPGILLASGLLGFWQEKGAANAVQELLGAIVALYVLAAEAAKRAFYRKA